MKTKQEFEEGCKNLSVFWLQLLPHNTKSRTKSIKEHLRLTLYFMNESHLSFEIACHFALCEMIENGLSFLSFEFEIQHQLAQVSTCVKHHGASRSTSGKQMG
jgi:hypothetical protein